MSRRPARHIAFFPLPATGHVNPNLAVAAELVRRGHQVSVVSTERYRTVIEATGARLVVCRPALGAPLGLRKERLARRLAFPFRTQALADARGALPQLKAGFGDELPDLALCDGIAYGGQLFAARCGIPTVQLRALFASNEHWAHVAEGGAERDDAAWAEFHTRLAAVIALYELDIEPDRFLAQEGHPHIVYLPRAFQYHGDTFDERFHFVGPCLRPRTGPGAEAATWQPPGDGRPVILVSLGTIDNQKPEFYRTCLASFEDQPWHVVLAVGERLDLAELGPVPSNVSAHRVVPQLDVLDHAAALVSHAGMGGVMEALAAGAPLVAVPQTREQDTNARRIADLGLGRRLAPADLTATALRDAVAAVRTDPEVAGRIAAMRDRIREAGGATRAADVIESLLA